MLTFFHQQLAFAQQESMSVNALFRHLETVAKSIKHATASSKLLLDHSIHELRNELRNAPINSQQLFDNKDKEVAKSYYEAQHHRFLASSTSNANIQQQQQKSSYSATGPFKKPRQPTKSYRLKQNQLYRSKNQSQS